MENPSTSKKRTDSDQQMKSKFRVRKEVKIDSTSRERSPQFTPHAKRKKNAHSKILLTPFPICTPTDQKFTGIFTGISVEVCDQNEMHSIYESGCFGKGSQSRSAPQLLNNVKGNKNIGETLSLDLEESFFLANYLKVLCIKDFNETEMQWQNQLQEFEKIKPNFVECFVAYLYLKSKNWIVKSGIKFGGDFLIYKSSLRHYHASFIVFISNSAVANKNLRPKDIKGIQRIAETSDKDVLLLEVTKPTKDFKIETLEDITLCRISETIIRRFNYNAFVQSQNKQK